jgi:hypothetical protein
MDKRLRALLTRLRSREKAVQPRRLTVVQPDDREQAVNPPRETRGHG